MLIYLECVEQLEEYPTCENKAIKLTLVCKIVGLLRSSTVKIAKLVLDDSHPSLQPIHSSSS